jgi:hypothetical protein
LWLSKCRKVRDHQQVTRSTISKKPRPETALSPPGQRPSGNHQVRNLQEAMNSDHKEARKSRTIRRSQGQRPPGSNEVRQIGTRSETTRGHEVRPRVYEVRPRVYEVRNQEEVKRSETFEGSEVDN